MLWDIAAWFFGISGVAAWGFVVVLAATIPEYPHVRKARR